MSDKDFANNVQRLTRSTDHVGLLALRLMCIITMVALMLMHLRFVRAFRWQRAVSCGMMVTYALVAFGLALCAGLQECGGKVLQLGLRSLYGMRLLTIASAVILMNLHFRYLRVLRPLMYQSIPGFGLIVNVALVIFLIICVGTGKFGFDELKVFIAGFGSVVMAMNAATIWRNWRRTGPLTQFVTELLGVVGVHLRRQVLIKAFLSAIAATIFLIDLTWTLLQSLQAHSQ